MLRLCVVYFFFQAEDGIRDLVRSRGLGDVYKRQHKSREYLKLNPNGLIPVLVDGDLVLYETAAICLHLSLIHI